MGEDRRPNVAGRTAREPEDQPPDPEQVKRDAQTLRERTRIDGHEGRSPADIEPED